MLCSEFFYTVAIMLRKDDLNDVSAFLFLKKRKYDVIKKNGTLNRHLHPYSLDEDVLIVLKKL